VFAGLGVAVGSGVFAGLGVAVGSGVFVGLGVAVGSGVFVGLGAAVGSGVFVTAGAGVSAGIGVFVITAPDSGADAARLEFPPDAGALPPAHALKSIITLKAVNISVNRLTGKSLSPLISIC
jgi:carbonic anhydrase/acetyltransferase-like protein (isoleucine patch superfamily)